MPRFNGATEVYRADFTPAVSHCQQLMLSKIAKQRLALSIRPKAFRAGDGAGDNGFH